MESQTLTPKNGMKIYLRNSAALEEVVVTGMTRMDRRMFTGATSIYGSSKPLWVVDGVIMEDVTDIDSDALS